MGKRPYILILLLAVLLLAGCGAMGDAAPSPTPPPTPSPDPTPVPLDGPLPLTLPGELTDDNAATWTTGEIVLSGGERMIGSLYLEWSHVPEDWTLLADGTPVTVKKDGFLHQYVELPAPAAQVVINLEGALCGLYAFEPAAAIPQWVQRWQPSWEQCDLLLLPTHADDEYVFFGGMIPYYAAQRGYRVQVAYLTNHWSQVLRPHELLDALWYAGLRNYPVIGPFDDRWSDTVAEAEQYLSRADAGAYLTELLRRFKPSVAVGHDLNGEYGHAQHIICARALTDAVLAAGDASCFPESAQVYGTWDTPKLYLHLYGENEIVMDWDVGLTAFDGKTAMDVAREAFAIHESQQGFFYVYGAGDDWDSRRFGLYRSTVGPDEQGGDVFEHITAFR